MIKISFKGETLADVIIQTEWFLKDYNCEIPPTQPPVYGESPVTTIHKKIDQEKIESLVEKRKPGRPPMSPEEKAAKNSELIREVVAKKMVGPPGFEPGASGPAPGGIPGALSPGDNHMKASPKKVTKEDLVAGFQKIMEKEKVSNPKLIDSNGSSLNGFKKVKEILARFEVKKLGELDENRYDEMNVHIADALG